MPIEVRMPLLGDVMQEGTLVAWLKADQEWVAQGQPLFSVETDKAVVEVDSPATGRLQQLVQVGDSVPVGAPVGIVFESESAARAPSDVPTMTAVGPAAVRQQVPMALVEEVEEVRASPLAKRLAREHGLDLRRIAGTGPHGRVVEADISAYLDQEWQRVAAAAAAEPVAPSVAVDGEPAVVPIRGRRRTIAERMQSSLQTMAQLTVGREVDVTRLVDLRDQLVELWERTEGIHITFTDLVLKATALALQDHRALNALIVDDAIHLLPAINIALAVDADEGLTVPVIKGADRRPLLEVAREAKRLTDLARAGRLTQEDLAGASFTISSMGSYGIDWFTPIINPPQVAILGIGRIRSLPSLANGQLVDRKVMNFCLTFDHRAMDGAPPARFLSRLAELIQTPVALIS